MSLTLDFFNGQLTGILTPAYFGNTVEQYLLALIAFVGVFIGIKLFKIIIVRWLEKMSEKTVTEIDDLLVSLMGELSWTLYLLLPVYGALQMLVVPQIINDIFYFAIFVVIVFYVIRAFMHVIDYVRKVLIKKRQIEEKDADTTPTGFLSST